MKYSLLSNLVRLTYISLGLWLTTLAPTLAVTFIPPVDNTAPSRGDGGASRSSIRFIPPPDNSAPDSATGGASRIGFIPPPGNSAPDNATGGASRIGFIPPPDNSAPDSATSGASRIGFTPPPDNAAPQSTVSGASRESRVEDSALFSSEEGSVAVHGFAPNYVTAMMPVTPVNLYGLTVSARPTIMAYLPETKAHTAIFSLKDETRSVIYRQVVPLDGADGILRITLHENAPELAVGKYYQWFVTLQTGQYITPSSPYVTAWIKRVDVASVVQVDGLTGLAKAKVLAQAGIWYDAAEQLAELQLNPQTQVDTIANWTEFLDSVGLDSLLEHSFL